MGRSEIASESLFFSTFSCQAALILEPVCDALVFPDEGRGKKRYAWWLAHGSHKSGSEGELLCAHIPIRAPSSSRSSLDGCVFELYNLRSSSVCFGVGRMRILRGMPEDISLSKTCLLSESGWW